MRAWTSVIKTMSDDQPLSATPVEPTTHTEPERNIKMEPSVTQEEVKPLSLQAEPPKDGYLAVAQQVRQHDEAMLKNGILFSALPKEQREEYNRLIKLRDDYIESIYSHTQRLKEEEPDFANENPEEWRDDFVKADGEQFMRAIAYCAASEKMHARNTQEKYALKRRIEELENEKKASPSPSSSQQQQGQGQERKVLTTGNAIANFAEKPASPQNYGHSQTTAPSSETVQGNALKIKPLGKMSHTEDFMDNPERPENKVSARLVSSFGWLKQPLVTNK